MGTGRATRARPPLHDHRLPLQGTSGGGDGKAGSVVRTVREKADDSRPAEIQNKAGPAELGGVGAVGGIRKLPQRARAKDDRGAPQGAVDL